MTASSEDERAQEARREQHPENYTRMPAPQTTSEDPTGTGRTLNNTQLVLGAALGALAIGLFFFVLLMQ